MLTKNNTSLSFLFASPSVSNMWFQEIKDLTGNCLRGVMKFFLCQVTCPWNLEETAFLLSRCLQIVRQVPGLLKGFFTRRAGGLEKDP